MEWHYFFASLKIQSDLLTSWKLLLSAIIFWSCLCKSAMQDILLLYICKYVLYWFPSPPPKKNTLLSDMNLELLRKNDCSYTPSQFVHISKSLSGNIQLFTFYRKTCVSSAIQAQFIK